MVATSLAQPIPATSGLRPVQPRRDLAGIADLIEVCFADTLDAGGRAMLHDMRVMARSGALVYRLARLSRAVPALQGYVWIADSRLVGNVSLMPAGYARGWVIANVAVDPAYRRQGIARALMIAALEYVARQGTFATLQVDADNLPARTLYERLGFRTQRIFTRWRRASYHRVPAALPDSPPIRRMRRAEAPALLAIAERERPNSRGGMGWLRPTEAAALRPARLALWQMLSTGQQADYYVIPGADRTIQAGVRVEQRLGGLTTLVDVLVPCEQRGAFEAPLLVHVLRAYPRRSIVLDHPADDPALGGIAQQYQFRPERALAHMIWIPAVT